MGLLIIVNERMKAIGKYARIMIVAAFAGLTIRGMADGCYVPSDAENATPETVARVKALKPGETLRFAPGIWHFRREGVERMFLSPSNNQSGEKDVVFPLVGKRDVTIDGGGATFVFHDGTFPFAAVGSEGVSVSNFTATTAQPPYAGFEVVGKAEDGFAVRFAKDAPPHRCENGHLVFCREDGEISSATERFSLHALEYVKIHYLYAGDSTASRENLPTTFIAADAESGPDATVFFRYRPAAHKMQLAACPFEVGDKVAVNLEQSRAHILFFGDASERIVFSDVRAERVAGMGFVAQMCGGVTVRNVRILPRDGELVSATADGFQFVNCHGKVLMDGCEVGWTMDDALNVHGNYLLVEKSAGCVAFLCIGHFEQSGFFPFRAGDRVLFREPKRRGVIGEAKVVSLGRPSADLMRAELTVDRELPSFPEGTLVEAVSRYPDFRMTRCHTHDQLSMRISGGGGFVFDGNRIGSGYCGLQINDLPSFWFEAGPVRSVVITNNVFENCTKRGGAGPFVSVGVSGFKAGDPDAPLIHDGIVIRDNRFVGLTGDAVRLTGARDPVVNLRLPSVGKDPEGRFHPTYASVHEGPAHKARPVPDFLRTAVMYQLFTRMFTPEGTLAAAMAQLPELKDLGVDFIYLTPFQLADDGTDRRYWSAGQKRSGMDNPRNPYRQKDYFAVDSEYGTADDLKAFVAAAHRLGMRVLFDLVYFHCGPNAVFLKEHPEFVVRKADGSFRLGDWAFPELDFANSALREYLYSNMTFLLEEYGADGFRCDVADMVPVGFWEEGYCRCKAVREDVILMCEGLRSDDQIAAFDLSYGFYVQWTLVDLLKGLTSAGLLEKAWRAERRDYPRGFHWMRCFENHDFANCYPGEARKEKLYGHELNAAMLATCFLLDGVPMIYNGQEIADAVPHSIWSDRNHGGWHVDWSRGDDAVARERKSLIRRLAALRKAHPGLFDAPVIWQQTDDPCTQYSFTRPLADGTSVGLFVDLKRRMFEITERQKGD